ncbi:MAG: FG-GAP and VCBS repeat-containing protein [Verrucomicrobiales bacterium]|nr:FG-GAP and VCBS repeat-containing protein [Verrucomicrobiales bacterium]
MKSALSFFAGTTVLCAMAFGSEAAIPAFRSVDVDTKVQIGYGLAIADVDGDQKPDIILVDKNIVAWYQNPAWKKHIMAEKLTELDHVCVAAADIDGDGKAEVAIGAGWNPGDTVNSGAVFYLIPPTDRTQQWEPVKLHHEPTVHRMKWVKNEQGKFDLVVVPLHGRGNKNGLGEGVKILAYHRPSNPRDGWKTSLLDASLHMTHNFDPVQWDRDAAQEMLVGGREGIFLLDPKSDSGKLMPLGGNSPGAGEIRLGKLKGGKRFIATVEPMHGTNTVVYTEPIAGEMKWNRRVIDETLVDGHAVACGDVLKAGYDQVVVGWRAMGKPGVKVGIKLYVSQDAEGKEWKSHLVDDNTMACEDLALADLNGDDRLDIIAAGRATKNLKIYLNEGAR